MENAEKYSRLGYSSCPLALLIVGNSVQQRHALKTLSQVVSWVAIFLCLEREGSKPQAGGDFKSPSEKVNEFVSFLILTFETTVNALI